MQTSLRTKHNIPNDAIIAIAGTVGVGKSTLTEELGKALGFKTAFEKVEGNPYLADFYDDMKKYSYQLQTYLLAERFKNQKRLFEYGGGVIQDRSIYEDTGIFAKMLYEQGNMSDVDYKTYTELFDAMVMTPYFPHPDLVIYIEGSNDEVLRRIKKRGRQMEQETPETYWVDLANRYEEWINQFTFSPVLRIDTDEFNDFFDEKQIEQIVAKIGRNLNAAITLRVVS
jgi:deoxyadenosine/deoxycytidine kinase